MTSACNPPGRTPCPQPNHLRGPLLFPPLLFTPTNSKNLKKHV
uniref:Uncharacterized protein n=1 Tax=Anguilla anguilla TaxID=7936 RepID=A0A0E9ST45_ANGAN